MAKKKFKKGDIITLADKNDAMYGKSFYRIENIHNDLYEIYSFQENEIYSTELVEEYLNSLRQNDKRFRSLEPYLIFEQLYRLANKIERVLYARR